MSAAVRAPEPPPEPANQPDSIPALFQQTAARRGDAPALFFKSGGRWVPISWADYARTVNRLANALLAEGLQPGDRVALWSANRPEWQIADLAILHAAGATVAVYQTLAPDQVKYLLGHSEARVLVVETAQLLERISQLRRELPSLQRIILIEGEAPEALGWQDALRRGEEFGRSRPGLLNSRWQALKADDLASLIYTSGTTGQPKGAMLTHRNLIWTTAASLQCFRGDPEDRTVSYLPLAHVLERVVSHLRQITTGCRVYFCPEIDKVMEAVREVHPTYFTSVPRLWEKIYAGVRERIKQVKGPRRLIVAWALRVAARKTAAYQQGKLMSRALLWQLPLADRLVFAKIRETLGFDQLLICISGSAPISPEILRFFYGMGIEILEGYGLTETTAPATFNRPLQSKFGTVGQPLPGVEIRTAEDGEVLVKGGNVFSGYYKNEKETHEAIDADGWLHTGDIGEIDKDGYLKITDRKKDLFKTSGGKYVAPGSMETVLRNHRGIGQAVVIGDGRPFVAALIALDHEVVKPDDPEANQIVEQAVADLNKGLSHPEQIKKFKIIDGEFTVGDELTPTMKVKRKRITEKYGPVIDALYSEKQRA
jgi:long-chain acyl-CoA synthetase